MEIMRRSDVTDGINGVLVAAALIVGALGGYSLRNVGVIVGTAASDGAAVESRLTGLVPRSAREGIEIAPFQAPAPRWTHEDDAPDNSIK